MIMKKILQKLTIGLAALSIMLMPAALVAVPVGAQTTSPQQQAVCDGVELTGGSCEAPGPGESSVQSVIRTVINILSFVVGVIAVIMIIIGGLRYITSGGDSNSTGAAKNTILYALIGLVIVAMAQVIVRFVLRQFI